MTKTCTKCKIELPIDEFTFKNKAKGYRSPTCRKCNSEYKKAHHQTYYQDEKVKARYRKQSNDWGKKRRSDIHSHLLPYLKSHPCIECGEKDPIVLEFDHRDPSTKLANIADLIRLRKPWDAIYEEILKCDVYCANCHRRKTAKQFGWYNKNIG